MIIPSNQSLTKGRATHVDVQCQDTTEAATDQGQMAAALEKDQESVEGVVVRDGVAS
jgi:hypothetical protein